VNTITKRAGQDRAQTGGRRAAATIVEYDGRRATLNDYPDRIISPPFPSECCAAAMKQVGDVEEDGRWLFIYKRCQSCGYTVRHVLMLSPAAMRSMRDDLLRSIDITHGRN
jgi:hypothetical protein